MNPNSVDLPEVSSNNFGIEPDLKLAARLKFFLPEWRKLTSDSQILKTVKGFNVEFVDCPPTQVFPSKEIPFNPEETHIVDSELDLTAKGSLLNPNTDWENSSPQFFFVKRRQEYIELSSI